MNILIELNKSYDFIPTKEKPTQEQLDSGEFIKLANGVVAKRELIDKKTESYFSIPEWQIEAQHKHFKMKNIEKTDNEVYANFIETYLMPRIAPRKAWGKFIVDNDKKLEKYLNNRFELGA